MKNNKLNLEKFSISKLSKPNLIIGGYAVLGDLTDGEGGGPGKCKKMSTEFEKEQ